MSIRNLSFKDLSIILLGGLLVASSGFGQTSLEISALKEITSEDGRILTSYGLSSAQIDDFRRLVSRTEGRVEASFDKTQKIPDLVKAEILFPPGITQPEEQGYYFFEEFRDLYGIRDPRREFRPTKVWEGRLQNINIRYEQYYEGIRVVDAEMLVHVKSDGKLWFVQGRYIPDIDISTVPAVERTEVLRIVESDFVVRRGTDVEFTISSPELGILNPWVYDRSLEYKNILIWIVVLRETLTGREFVYSIDAQNGQILDTADSARFIDSEIWDRQNTAATNDDERWYIDNLLQTIPGGTLDPETTDLNAFVTGYWNYLLNTFGVYSINSATTPDGRQLVGHAYFLDPTVLGCPNACWDCFNDQAIFCQGEVLRDVVAHEFTHGLVEHSGGNLVYRNQSGALNESFADVFAEFVDCDAGNCTWLFGNWRDLSNPLNRDQQPDYTGSTGNAMVDHPFYHLPCDPTVPPHCTPNNDFGGVHTNSGIPNIVAYLIVNGTRPNDPHYNYHVRGIGLAKAEQLYYSTLVDAGLTNTADFINARSVMVTVCQGFVTNQRHGFTANDCCQVQAAWASVGIGSACRTFNSGSVSGTCSTSEMPCFVTDDGTIPAGATLTIDPNVDVYFFPNTKMKANGILQADGTSGNIRLLSSSDSDGVRISRQFGLRNGGEIGMAVNAFSSHDTRPNAISLRDGGQVSSFIRIDKGFTITDVNVTLTITHTFDSNLTVTLQSPGGTQVVLFANVGGNGDNFTNTTLDDEAITPIGAGIPPFTGAFRPQNNLGAFDGQNSRGYWRLRVADNVPGNTGTLQSWSLTFNQ